MEDLGKLIWNESFFKPLFPTVTQTFFKLIKEYRNNKSSIDIGLVKNIIELYINPNYEKMINEFSDKYSRSEPIIDIYKKYFEIEFLRDVEDFYLKQKTPSLESKSINEYLTQACHKFINNNAITQKADTTTKSAELLARYCDELLQKGDETIKEKFNEIMIIFNYIEDKDVYEKFYRKMLSKRLVDQLRTDGDDDEKLMISKLKVYNLSIMILTLHFTLFLQQTCGFEYTSRFERMMQDVDVSKNLTNEYQSYCKTNNPKSIVNFSVMVLNSNLWPFSSLPNVILPVELKAILDSFTDFYTHRHNSRKLMWLHQHSKGEIQTYFT
ncbi:unnamed protein product [Rotaria sp. Silwood2]|nr:unnamed protein product [Rotaria sp. Silwood2]